MQRQMRATVAALTATFSIVAVATVVEAADEEPITTTTTTEAPPPPVTLEVVIEPEPEGQEPAPGYVTEQTEPTTADDGAGRRSRPRLRRQTSRSTRRRPRAATVAVEEPTTTAAPSATHDQEAIVTGTQVAVGNSGGNQTVNDSNQPPTGSVPLGTEIDTGNADAIGSRDENIIVQQADVVLTDQAVANILQIALILNIGAALANSRRQRRRLVARRIVQPGRRSGPATPRPPA